jgi:hypothetical protein
MGSAAKIAGGDGQIGDVRNTDRERQRLAGEAVRRTLAVPALIELQQGLLDRIA